MVGARERDSVKLSCASSPLRHEGARRTPKADFGFAPESELWCERAPLANAFSREGSAHSNAEFFVPTRELTDDVSSRRKPKIGSHPANAASTTSLSTHAYLARPLP